MKDLILPKTNAVLDHHILAIIKFVKKVEREHGLTEEQITHKYTCGECYFLAVDIIIKTIKRLFGAVKIRAVAKSVNSQYIGYHYYIERETLSGKRFYYDIFGKKTFEEMKNFVEGDFWEKEYQKDWIDDFECGDEMYDTDYVEDACKQYIKVEGVTA